MSAQGTLPSSTARRSPLIGIVLGATVVASIAAAYAIGWRAGSTREVMSAMPSAAQRIAFVRERPCGSSTCQSLWMGGTRADAVEVAVLGRDERCEEIAWAADGYRIGFLVNGYQLRVFDFESRKPVGQKNLIEPDGTPTTRVARGITFSQNGAAVTFDDCPRAHSGCRSGLVAVR